MTDTEELLDETQYDDNASFNFRRSMWEHKSAGFNIYDQVNASLVETVLDISRASEGKRDFLEEPIHIVDIGCNDARQMIELQDLMIDRGVDVDFKFTLIDPVLSHIPNWFIEQDHVDIKAMEFNSLSLDSLEDVADIVNMQFCLYHLESDSDTVRILNEILTTDVNSGYVFITNVGDQYLSPIINPDEIRKFSGLSNDLMAYILITDSDETFMTTSCIQYKTSAILGIEMLKDYESKHSMFAKSDKVSNFFINGWEANNTHGVAMLDFRTDTYRRTKSVFPAN